MDLVDIVVIVATLLSLPIFIPEKPMTDFIAAFRLFLREWKRLRWIRARRASIHTPFE